MTDHRTTPTQAAAARRRKAAERRVGATGQPMEQIAASTFTAEEHELAVKVDALMLPDADGTVSVHWVRLQQEAMGLAQATFMVVCHDDTAQACATACVAFGIIGDRMTDEGLDTRVSLSDVATDVGVCLEIAALAKLQPATMDTPPAAQCPVTVIADGMARSSCTSAEGHDGDHTFTPLAPDAL